jgi:hypothetical protein
MKTWSPTHLQPVGVPCCQRSDSRPTPDVAAEKKPTDSALGVFSSWTWVYKIVIAIARAYYCVRNGATARLCPVYMSPSDL